MPAGRKFVKQLGGILNQSHVFARDVRSHRTSLTNTGDWSPAAVPRAIHKNMAQIVK